MPRRKRILTIGALFLAAALSAMDHAGVFGYRGNDRLRYDHVEAPVVSVLNGSTIEVGIPDGPASTTRVRLLGITAADSSAARAALQESVAIGRVRLVLDPNHRTRDESGALLAYVYAAGGSELLNEELIRIGAAQADPSFVSVMNHRFNELQARTAKAAPAARG